VTDLATVVAWAADLCEGASSREGRRAVACSERHSGLPNAARSMAAPMRFFSRVLCLGLLLNGLLVALAEDCDAAIPRWPKDWAIPISPAREMFSDVQVSVLFPRDGQVATRPRESAPPRAIRPAAARAAQRGRRRCSATTSPSS
jgi:hypothetical protein